ncbi:hypothetical protein AB0J38_25860 [Streptomyces sp. NPDC050095]|uniref:hypothetical protein n=1 Tax=unclassified Streptomyces TaxID=2593676 RepID=UPI003444DAC4
MNRTLARFSVAAISMAALVAATSTGSAYAATGAAGCSISSASGGATFTNWTSSHVDIQGMNVYDLAADGHHVAIRLWSYGAKGSASHAWPWHHNYAGKDTSIIFNTTASNAYGPLTHLGVEVATMEGSTIISYCLDWAPALS